MRITGRVGPAMVLGLVALWLASGCTPPKEEGEEAKAEGAAPKETKTPVETIELQPVDFTKLVHLTGETEADEALTVSSEINGLVVRTNFEEGKPVKKGQWLARIDVRMDYVRARQLRDNLEQAEKDLKRAEILRQKGLATSSDVERAKLNVRTVKSNLRITNVGVGKSTVNAPIAGVVDKIHVEAGEYAMPGQPVATIVNYDTIIVRAGLPESQLRYAREGASLKVRIPALDLEREGTVRRIGIQANSKNRTFPVQIAIDNTDHKIRTGMRAMVKLPTQHTKDALLVPREVVIDTPEGRIVYIVEGGKASRRAVTLGPDRGDFVVLKTGVKVGDEVVSVGQHGLPRSATVEVTDKKPCCREEVKGGGQ